MPRDWKDISDDEVLNFSGPQTAEIARYDRIMQKRSIDAIVGLRDKVSGLMETVFRASQGFQEKSDNLFHLYERISKAQGRQQLVLVILTVVVAASTVAYTWITWQSVTAMREANDIQRQFLELQKPIAADKTAPNSTGERDTRKSSARPSP